MILKKIFFKLMNHAVFGKTLENVRKYTDNEFATIERRRKFLVAEPNYHTTFFYREFVRNKNENN